MGTALQPGLATPGSRCPHGKLQPASRQEDTVTDFAGLGPFRPPPALLEEEGEAAAAITAATAAVTVARLVV